MARCWTSTDGNINYINGQYKADSTPCYGNCAPYPSFALASGSISGLTGALYKGSSSAYQVFGEMPSPVYGCSQAQSGFRQIPIAVPRSPFTNGVWHSSAQTSCHQQACAARNTPGRDHDHLQIPHNTDSTGSAGSEDSYWSVRNFPVSNTRPGVAKTQPSLHDGTDSMDMPQKADYNNMKARTVLHPVPETHTLECVPSENQSRLCETKWLSPEQQRPEHHDKRSTQQVSATVEVFTPMGSGTLAQQQHDVTKIDHTANPKPIFSKLLEEGVANKEDNEQRDQEVQRKREQDEGQMELHHFRYKAFDLLEEEHVCEADTVEFDADYVLSSLKEVLYDGKLSLCHFNFEQWVKQISKTEEKILLDGIADLPLLEAINTVAAEVFMSRIEQIGNPHWNFRATSLYELKFFDTSGQISQLGSKEWNIISTEEISKHIVHLTFSEKIASWSLCPLQQDCTTDAKLIIQWDPGVHNNRESAWISLLHPVTIGLRLILPWDPGNYSSKIRTKWLPLKSNTTNVNLLLPWDPGEPDLLHVHHMAIILFPLASNGSYVVRWQFLYHEGFSEACTLHGNDFSLVSSYHLKIVHPVPKSEIDLQLLQPAGLMVCTISLYSKAETNLFGTSWAGKFHYVAPATIGIWSGLEKLMCWTQYSFVVYLHTCTLKLVEAVTCLLIALLCKGVQLVFILSTDCCHLRLSELSALMFELFKVCIDNWKGADTLARMFAGNIGETSMRIFAPVLLQAQKYFSLDFVEKTQETRGIMPTDFSLFFASIMNVLYIATVEVSPNALHEHVQMGRIAKYMHWIQCSDFINLKDFLMSKDSSLWWFSAYKRAFVQWDPGIVSSDLYARVEMLTAWQNSEMNQVPGPLIGYSCMYIGAEAAVFTLPYSTLGMVAECGDPDGSLHEHDAYSNGIKILSFWIAYSFIKNVFCLQLQHQAEKKAPWIVSFRPP